MDEDDVRAVQTCRIKFVMLTATITAKINCGLLTRGTIAEEGSQVMTKNKSYAITGGECHYIF